jgi:hypothetical protein
MVDVFKGYNHNLRIGDGEFFEHFFIPGICAIGGFDACISLAGCEISYF